MFPGGGGGEGGEGGGREPTYGPETPSIFFSTHLTPNIILANFDTKN